MTLKAYEACASRIPNDEIAIRYVRENIESIDCLAPVYKHGDFNGEPPLEFWKAQAVYVAHASLYSIKWAEAFSDYNDGKSKGFIV
mgnify:CR=1 FL=1